MISNELVLRVKQALGFMPTADQQHAIQVFAQFLTSRHSRAVMVLRGSAGTGKTSLGAALVSALLQLKQRLVLLAPTGRAAKVFSLHAAVPAYTIHRRIYRQKTAGDLSAFSLNANLQRDTLFIVDEASMIDNQGFADSAFGSGCLLDDLIQFVYGADNGCRLVLIGDRAQLPPIGATDSQALMPPVLSAYGLHVFEADLDEVLRQSVHSGILYNATAVRNSLHAMVDDIPLQLPKVRFQGFADISIVPGDELIESLASSYSYAGLDDTIVITRSNKRANIYNEGIRRTVLDREGQLSRGDRLMIVKNNYYFKPAADADSKDTVGGFLANGDVAVVQRVRNVHEQYGFHFAEVTMLLPDYDDYELTATVLLDTLNAEAPALTREQQQQLYDRLMEDYADLPRKADRQNALRQDRYYNALQVKFAYAVTCHKAQGGQWQHVYLDQGYMTDDMLTPDYLHWLYTAFTRATEHLYLVNWPRTQVAE